MAIGQRMQYCPGCKAAHLRGYFEKPQCPQCRQECIPVTVPYSAYTVLSWAILLVFATFLLYYKDIPMPQKIEILVVALVIAIPFAVAGISRMRRRACEMAEGARGE